MMNGQIQYFNPEGLAENPAFSQVVITRGSGKTIYIGGQNAVDRNNQVVGKGDITLQTERTLSNILTALQACSASPEHLVKLTIYMVNGQNLQSAFKASKKIMDKIPIPPAVTVLFVVGLANPDFLIEIDAVAFLPE